MPEKKYSIGKGLLKSLISLLAVGGGVVAFMGFSDLTIWSLLEQYLKPLLGSLTIGGLITLGVNWIKVKTKA